MNSPISQQVDSKGQLTFDSIRPREPMGSLDHDARFYDRNALGAGHPRLWYAQRFCWGASQFNQVDGILDKDLEVPSAES